MQWHFSTLIALACLTMGAANASAQDTAVDAQKAQSDALFHQGMQQLESGDTYNACESFAASYRLVQRTGTLLNLVNCHRQAGQLLLARRELREVRVRALRDGQSERVANADLQLREIDSQLGWIHVSVAAESADQSARLRLDGATLALVQNEPLPVMPGEHAVRLEAEGFDSREVVVTVARGQHTNVVFQPLQARPQAALAPPPPAPALAPVPTVTPAQHRRDDREPSGTLRTVALVAGIVGVAASVGFGAWALERKAVLDDRCQGHECRSASDLRAADTGRAVAVISTVAFGVGVTGFGAWVFLPGGPLNRGSTSDRSAGVSLRGVF